MPLFEPHEPELARQGTVPDASRRQSHVLVKPLLDDDSRKSSDKTECETDEPKSVYPDRCQVGGEGCEWRKEGRRDEIAAGAGEDSELDLDRLEHERRGYPRIVGRQLLGRLGNESCNNGRKECRLWIVDGCQTQAS